MSKEGSKFQAGDVILCIALPQSSGKTTAIRVGDRAMLEKCKRKMSKSVMLQPSLRWRVYRRGSKKKTKKTYCYWAHDDDCYVPDDANSLEARIRIESQILGGVA